MLTSHPSEISTTLNGAVDAIDLHRLADWSFIDFPTLRDLIAQGDTFFVLILLSDCPACHQALFAINVARLKSLGIACHAVVFPELQPDSMRRLGRLKVAVAPEGRLYSGGAVVSAWRSIPPGTSNAEINDFVFTWLNGQVGPRPPSGEEG